MMWLTCCHKAATEALKATNDVADMLSQAAATEALMWLTCCHKQQQLKH